MKHTETIINLLKLANIEYYNYSVPEIIYSSSSSSFLGNTHKRLVLPPKQQIFQVDREIDALLNSAGIPFIKHEYTREMEGIRNYFYFVDEGPQNEPEIQQGP